VTLNINHVIRAVAEARKQTSQDRILVTLSAFTYAFLRDELLKFQKSDGHVEYLIDTRVPSGSVEVRNVQGEAAGILGIPQMVDCREKARHA
jgi:hypothetical protein